MFTLVMAPIASMIATAMGFSGEHVHYDHTWHTSAEWAQAQAAPRDSHHHAHGHGDHDHDLALAVQDDSDAQDDDGAAPLKHSHADQVHAAPFVTVAAPLLLLPDFNVAVVSAPASFPVQQHPYPPFRPPQNVLSA